MDEYYYLDAEGKQQGPVPPSDFLRLGITQSTLLWKNGMAGWQAAGMIPELSGYFQPTPPPPPSNVQPTPPPVQRGASASATQQPPVEKPDSFLVWSILTTVLCCLPLGIVAIVYSTKVDPLWDKGQYTEAADAAKNAKTFCILSLVFGIIGIVGAFMMGALGALGSM